MPPRDPTLSRRRMIAAISAMAACTSPAGRAAASTSTPGLSRDAESIHQEIDFDASRPRVYAALVEAPRFHEVTRLGGAAKLLGAPGAAPTAIDARPGGTFTLFGGYISGVQVDLKENERIVQAWHEHAWDPGEYSLVRFVLADRGAGTRLVFDHRGFPDGAGPHLSQGWYENYWNPLKAYLARG